MTTPLSSIAHKNEMATDLTAAAVLKLEGRNLEKVEIIYDFVVSS